MKKTLLIGALAILLCGFAAAQQFQVIASFNGPPAFGIVPVGNLLTDSQGNIYGVTSYGGPSKGCGTNGCGTIYEVSLENGRYWQMTVLYDFCSRANCADGAIPESGMVMDAAGNLYGTASAGGTACPVTPLGCGVVYELSPPPYSGARWTYNVLYSFCSQVNGTTCTDGASPIGSLSLGSAGNLYGTTSVGGSTAIAGGQGTVYKLTKGGGRWTETVLYQFCSQYNGTYCPDGSQPTSGVLIGEAGTLYGTAPLGGSSQNAGLVYVLTPSSVGMTETNLFAFAPNQAFNGGAPVSVDALNNLYTTFASGGPSGTGGILRLHASGSPHFFYFGEQSNGANPRTGIVVDSAQNIAYGITSAGGTSDSGTVYEITRTGQETVLYSFCGGCFEGGTPSGIVVTPAGTIYGATVYGAAGGNGEIFEITQ